MNNTTLKGLILSLYKSINWHHKKQWTELSYWIFFCGRGWPQKKYFFFWPRSKNFLKKSADFSPDLPPHFYEKMN